MYVCMYVYVRTSGVTRSCVGIRKYDVRTYVYAYAYLGSCVLHALGQP